MCNQDVRSYARVKDVKLWEIAAALHLCDSNFSRKLRFELPVDEKEKIKKIIDNISHERSKK